MMINSFAYAKSVAKLRLLTDVSQDSSVYIEDVTVNGI